jgi:hypothetical protein
MILIAGTVPTPTSAPSIFEGFRFEPMTDFQAVFNNSSGVSQKYTFKKGQIYTLQYYKIGSKYYFVIYVGSQRIVNYSSTTNRWGSETYGLLFNLQNV